jgi:pimeloyl-ACP methyl ester carboxylesterase
MPLVSVNGTGIFYERGGSGPPVIFVHGGFPSLATRLERLAEGARTWEADLARHFDFVWYDRRGCYRSGCPDTGYDLENQARDLSSLMDHIQMESAHLIGSSAGGPIALVFASLWPHRIRSLTLAGTGMELFPEGDPISDLIRAQIALLERSGPEAAFDERPAGVEISLDPLWSRAEAKARGRLEAYLANHSSLLERAQAVSREEKVRSYAIELRSIQAYIARDVRQDAPRIVAPTLVLHGGDDREVRLAWGEEVARTILTARLHVVKDGGHSLVHRSEEGRRIAIEFISDLEGRHDSSD